MRRKNQELSRATIQQLEEKIAELQLEVDEKKDLESRIVGLEEERDIMSCKLEECDDWVKSTLTFMSPEGRTEFRTAARAAANTFSAGTNRRLRNNIGLNVSMPMTVSTREDSELKKAVQAFAHQHSTEVPDARKASKGIRYHANFLCVLHQWFLSATDHSISYSVFCSYWPANIVKPRVQDWGTCMVRTEIILFYCTTHLLHCTVHCLCTILQYSVYILSKSRAPVGRAEEGRSAQLQLRPQSRHPGGHRWRHYGRGRFLG